MAARAGPLPTSGIFRPTSESYSKDFPPDKVFPNMLDPEVTEETVKILDEAAKDKTQLNPIVDNPAGGNAPLIAEENVARLHSEKQQSPL